MILFRKSLAVNIMLAARLFLINRAQNPVKNKNITHTHCGEKKGRKGRVVGENKHFIILQNAHKSINIYTSILFLCLFYDSLS